MNRASGRTCAGLLCCVVCSVPLVSAAQKVTNAHRAVDVVIINGGPVYGAILDAGPQYVRMAVSRDWLKTARPNLYQQHHTAERVTQEKILRKVAERIEKWSIERRTDRELKIALAAERDRINRLLQNPAQPGQPSQFLVLTLPRKRVRRLIQQPANKRRIAALSWQELLPNVESRSSRELEQTLRAKGIDTAHARPNLSQRLPAQQDSEDEWAIRQALFEYQFRKPIDVHGTGDFAMLAGADSQPGVGALIPLVGSMQKQLIESLTEPAGSKSPVKDVALRTAIREAEAVDARGFRITRLGSVLQRPLKVTTQFYARKLDGRWQRVFESQAVAKPAGIVDAKSSPLTADPRVGQIVKIWQSVGGQEAALSTALGVGEATREALQTVDGDFREFLDPYLNGLTGPPVPARPK